MFSKIGDPAYLYISSSIFWFFPYTAGKFYRKCVSIYMSLINTPNLSTPCLRSYKSVVRYSWSLVTYSSQLFANFFLGIVSEALVGGWNFRCSFSHTFLVPPLGKFFIYNSSSIWKQIVLSCDRIMPLYEYLFNFFSVVLNPWYFICPFF